jgi:stage V sporulation protein AB
MDWILNALLMFIGLAGGLAVGGGLVAFLTVLDVIPRLARMIRAQGSIRLFESSVIAGAVYWTLADFFSWSLPLSVSTPGVIGAFMGVFVGMLAGALTEVLNVIPIFARRLGMKTYLIWLLMAMIFGKMAGSLIHWIWILP